MATEVHDNPEVLLAEARSGSPESLGRLLQHYSNYLRLLASTQLDEKLRARFSASDVVQDTFYEAHRDFAEFRGGTEREFLGWLRQILVNNLSHLVEQHVLAEKRNVRREVSLKRIGEAVGRSTARLEAMLVDQAPSPSADARRREHSVILADQLSALSDDYREVLVLRHLEGLPFEEVAQRMGRTSGAARMLWLRALGKLREMLAEKGLV
jgi:RNA polymerase sigma-70 factor, ECF subfamily